VLIRHGRPAIAIRPRTGHQGFHAYIADYEEAGLDPSSLPPAELHDLVAEVERVFTSVKRRAHESAALLAPHAELAPNPIFVEAPLAAPRIPLLRMTVTKWAVIARLLWHAGYHPEIEASVAASHRARAAAKFLIDHASREGTAILVAHGYFNFLIGRVLLAKGFQRTGRDRARFWNAVIYEKEETS
jgi:broad specificity phosphatase PhoE